MLLITFKQSFNQVLLPFLWLPNLGKSQFGWSDESQPLNKLNLLHLLSSLMFNRLTYLVTSFQIVLKANFLFDIPETPQQS